MKHKGLLRIILAAWCATVTALSAQALDLPSIDALTGSGKAMEICHGDMNKQGAMMSSAGIGLVKASSTKVRIEGFYNGNFDVEMTYLAGKGSLETGPFAGRATKPDGMPGEYAGKYLTIKRVLGISTKLGAFYFNIPDTLGLQQGLNALMNLSTTYSANSYGGHDYTFKAITVEGELAAQILSVVSSLIPSDGTGLTPEIIASLTEALTKDADVSVGAIQLSVADDAEGTGSSTLATMESYIVSGYEANATATDSYDVSRNAVQRSYPMALFMDREAGTFTLLNLGNRGFAISDSLYDVTVENTDSAGNVTTSTKKVLDTRRSAIRGTFNMADGTFSIESKQQTQVDLSLFSPIGSVLGDMSVGEGRIWNARKSSLLGWSADNSNPVVSGTFTLTQGNIRHSGDNLWHSNVAGGALHTLAESNIAMTFNGTYTTKWSGGNILDTKRNIFISDTKIMSEGGADTDITHDVKIEPATVGSYTGFGVNSASAGTKLEIFGSLHPTTSTDNVDHYEIYLHHTKVDKISTTALIGNYSAETGIKNSNFAGNVSLPSNGAENTPFYFRMAAADITNNHTKPLFGSKPELNIETDEFALFVKTVYNNGLAPTFHALQPSMKSLGITTSVSGTESDEGFMARSQPGAIEVCGTQTVNIVDINGRCIYRGEAATIAVPAGVYIVRSSSVSVKLLVH